ncbi:MAG: hypothetical protein J7K58_00415 [Euryarchaeota archaeon]|nr:hypothetical protein [Euryarchaeota archaeon]
MEDKSASHKSRTSRSLCRSRCRYRGYDIWRTNEKRFTRTLRIHAFQRLWSIAISQKSHKKKYYVLKENIPIVVNGIKLTPFRTIHTEPSTVGFRIKVGNKKVTYVADTKYFSNLRHYIDESDLVILPVTLPRNYQLPHHLNTADTIKLLKGLNINLCIITHFGSRMLRSDPEKEAMWIKKETGLEVIAAHDGLEIEL